jgi:hypothetical protein
MINLGFSGNGKADPEVAELMADLGASAFVLDPLPNLFPDQIKERLPKFIEILRLKHRDTPILLMQCPLFPDMPYSGTRAERVSASNKHLREVYEARIAAGDHHIWLVPACDFTVEGGDATVDGVHPTDVGFLRLADTIEATFWTVLKSGPR